MDACVKAWSLFESKENPAASDDWYFWADG